MFNSSLVLNTCFYNNIWHILDGSKHPSFRMMMSVVGRRASGICYKSHLLVKLYSFLHPSVDCFHICHACISNRAAHFECSCVKVVLSFFKGQSSNIPESAEIHLLLKLEAFLHPSMNCFHIWRACVSHRSAHFDWLPLKVFTEILPTMKTFYRYHLKPGNPVH